MAGRPLTSEEREAAEAAFNGYECLAAWSASAHAIYDGIVEARLRMVLHQTPLLAEDAKPDVGAQRRRRLVPLSAHPTNDSDVT